MPTRDLSPLPKSDVKIGEPLKFPIYDGEGQLLLAAGQTVSSDRQLEELAEKGLYQNPRWASQVVHSRAAAGTVAPKGELKTSSRKSEQEDPSESGSTMKMAPDGSDDSFIVKLVGTVGREAFLVTHPVRDQGLVYIKEGQVWEFRAFYSTSVFRFKTPIQKVILAPHPLVIAAWPQEPQMEARVIRAARRVLCDLPAIVKVNVAGQVSASPGTVSNLSASGAEFTTWHKLKVTAGDRIRLAFQIVLHDHKFLLEPEAQVVSVNESADKAHVHLGLSFDQLRPDEFAPIHAFIQGRLVQRLESPLYHHKSGN